MLPLPVNYVTSNRNYVVLTNFLVQNGTDEVTHDPVLPHPVFPFRLGSDKMVGN